MPRALVLPAVLLSAYVVGCLGVGAVLAEPVELDAGFVARALSATLVQTAALALLALLARLRARTGVARAGGAGERA